MSFSTAIAAVSLGFSVLTFQSGLVPLADGVLKAPADVPSGEYKMDVRHTSLIARIGHRGGLSISSFRFAKSAAALEWNGQHPEKSKVAVTVDMASIMTPVPDFAQELAGEKFLNAGKFPEARFESTSIRKTGEDRGEISGILTFMGQSRPVVIDARMQAAAVVKGQAVIGFSGSLKFKRSDFGFTALLGPIGDDVEIIIDTEFGHV